MLIDGTYFKGLTAIDGLNLETGAPSISRQATAGFLNSFIETYEKEYLALVLGRDMCRQFVSYLRLETEEKVEKWEKLREFLTKDGDSPIAYYVFFFFVRRNDAHVSSTGVVGCSGDDKVDASIVQIPAWNEMTEMNYELLDFLCSNEEYDGFTFDRTMLEPINQFGI